MVAVRDNAMSLQDSDGNSSDRTLLQRYRRGDGDAATELYLRYAERLRRLARSKASPQLQREVDSEDMIQSVFRTFFRRAADGQYEIPEGEELWRLLLVIGLNKIRALATFHHADKRDIHKKVVGDEVALLTKAESDNESLHMLRMTIDDLLAPMPEEYREIVDLRIAGFGVADIAAKSGRAKRSVERILQEFRRKLDGLIHES